MGDSSELNSVPGPLARVESVKTRAIGELYHQLDKLQWWPAEKLLAQQLRELEKLLGYASQHSPFYRRQLAGRDLHSLTMDKVRELPILARQKVREAGRQLGCEPVPKTMGALTDSVTSGSTGSPVTVKATTFGAAMWGAISLRDHVWHRRDARLSSAAIRWRIENVGMAPDGWVLPDWGEPHSLFFDTGPAYYLHSSCNTSEQAEWLLRRNPHYLISHPSNLMALLEELRSSKQRPERLLQLRCVGEALPAGLRELAQEVLDVPVVDFYSSQEVGYLALQCPDFDHYHVQSESLLVELLDEAGQPVGRGQSGRVVVSDLRNYASPLIRYEIGDYAEWGEPCPCGRGLPVLARINGRVRGMLTLPGGERRWPNFGFREISAVVSLRQFQLLQHEPDRIELKVVVDEPMTLEQESRVAQTLQRYLGFPFRIDITYHRSIPRGPSGKYEDFISLVNSDSGDR